MNTLLSRFHGSHQWVADPFLKNAATRGAFIVPGVLTILAILTFGFRFIDHFTVSRLLTSYQSTVSAPAGQPGEPDPVMAEAMQSRVKRINDRSPFAMIMPPQLTGILGDEAFFGGMGVPVGGSFMKIKVIRINGDSVDVEIDGKPSTLFVFGPGGGPGPMGGMGPMRRRRRNMQGQGGNNGGGGAPAPGTGGPPGMIQFTPAG